MEQCMMAREQHWTVRYCDVHHSRRAREVQWTARPRVTVPAQHCRGEAPQGDQLLPLLPGQGGAQDEGQPGPPPRARHHREPYHAGGEGLLLH